MSTTTLERVALSVSDGTKMHAYIARPANVTATTPGMIVFQEAFGVNDHIRSVAARFAENGFLAIAPELYHRTGDGVEYDYTSPREERAVHSSAITIDGLAADAKAAYDWLTREGKIAAPKIACVGYCMGGRTSYVANAFIPLAGAISFYGGGCHEMTHLAAKQSAPILMFWGGQDKGIDAKQRRTVEDALDAAKKPHTQVLFSYADHGFFCDARASYSADAARQAWALSMEYLRNRNVIS